MTNHIECRIFHIHIKKRVTRVEKLLAEIEPEKKYPYQYICFRITEYRPDSYPDLVIADYRLAGEELGTEVVARLRHELGWAVPALLISGDSSTATLEVLRASGLEFLLKPVLPEELRAVSSRLIAAGRHAEHSAGGVSHLGRESAASARV